MRYTIIDKCYCDELVYLIVSLFFFRFYLYFSIPVLSFPLFLFVPLSLEEVLVVLVLDTILLNRSVFHSFHSAQQAALLLQTAKISFNRVNVTLAKVIAGF